jgi:hypothetical protein
LHIIKSKISKKELWKTMKGNYLAFDAFGQWFEHEGNKMRWMEKVRGEWRPRLGRPTTYSLFSHFLLH